jgi:thiamine biosynthesis lipoprotein
MTLVADIFTVKHPSRHILPAFLCLLCLLMMACGTSPAPQQLTGSTMGTTYHVTWLDRGNAPAPVAVSAAMEAILEAVNASMSTYRPDSEISTFNALPVDQWLLVSADFYQVLEMSRTVSLASAGAYDVTIATLVDLWGFGPNKTSQPPSPAAIAAGLSQVGLSRIEVDEQRRALRKRAAVQLDFSSIAKGYGVDLLAAWLDSQGIVDYLVEIGGEIRVRGLSPRGGPWRIAVEKPDPMVRESTVTLELGDSAVATSGDYRNYFEHEGVRYSHTIDPRTGWPVRHQLVSVTVVHETAALADAWATALTVLGTDAALRTATEQGLAVYLISRDGEAFTVQKTAEIEGLIR